MTLQPSTANFSLINYSQEKDLNNLVATRKHQKNPEKILTWSLAILKQVVSNLEKNLGSTWKESIQSSL